MWRERPAWETTSSAGRQSRRSWRRPWRNASERALIYVKSEIQVENFELKTDLVEDYAKVTVKAIQEIEKVWFKDASAGDCYHFKIMAELLPDEKAISKTATDR